MASQSLIEPDQAATIVENNSKKIPTLEELKRCLNCGVASKNIHYSNTLSPKMQAILSQWIGRPIPKNGGICTRCKTKIKKCENEDHPSRVLGCPQVCVGCGRSTIGRRCRVDSRIRTNICVRNMGVCPESGCYYVSYKIYICFVCTTRAKKYIEQRILKQEKLKLELNETSGRDDSSKIKSEPVDTVECDRSSLMQTCKMKVEELAIGSAYIPEVCGRCDRSVIGKRRTFYQDDDFIELKNQYLCNACSQAVRRMSILKRKKEQEKLNPVIKDDIDAESSESESDMVARVEGDRFILPSFKRLLFNRKYCLYPGCKEPSEILPKLRRKIIFQQYGVLLNRRARACKSHNLDWKYLKKYRSTSSYPVDVVQEMLSLAQNPMSINDFDRINEMPEHICKYWTGLGVEEFKELYSKLEYDTDQYQSLTNGLAIYLLKKKTGDSSMRLANLFLINTKVLMKQLVIIENCLEKINN